MLISRSRSPEPAYLLGSICGMGMTALALCCSPSTAPPTPVRPVVTVAAAPVVPEVVESEEEEEQATADKPKQTKCIRWQGRCALPTTGIDSCDRYVEVVMDCVEHGEGEQGALLAGANLADSYRATPPKTREPLASACQEGLKVMAIGSCPE